MANLEELRIFLSSFVHKLVIESGCSINAISWVSSSSNVSWRFQFYLNEIKVLVSSVQVEFQHVGSLTNNFADCLAKQGVDESLRFGCFHYVIFYVCVLLYFFPYNSCMPSLLPLSWGWGDWISLSSFSLINLTVKNKYIKESGLQPSSWRLRRTGNCWRIQLPYLRLRPWPCLRSTPQVAWINFDANAVPNLWSRARSQSNIGEVTRWEVNQDGTS